MTFFNRRPELEAVIQWHSADESGTWSVEHRTEHIDHRPATQAGDPDPWAVTRTGERAEILWPVRRAVAIRDNMTCRICHDPERRKFELDHIIPWSAGGSDRSTNLRLTCDHCNQRRSNRVDVNERPAIPVTWWCVECWTHELDWRFEWSHNGTATEWLNIEHRVSPDAGYVTAFCAQCRHISRTDVTL